MKFEVDESQMDKLEAWITEQDLKAVEIQKQTPRHHKDTCYTMMWENGVPYTGAIGGAISYTFTPTSIGVVATVTHAITKEELNVTDFDSW